MRIQLNPEAFISKLLITFCLWKARRDRLCLVMDQVHENGLQNSKKEMDIRQVHKGFSSFIEKYLPYLKFFQSGALQYFDWFQSPKHLILGTHYAYSNRDGWWTAAWSLYAKLWSTIWWILIGSRDLGGSGTTPRHLTFSLQHVCKIVLHTYITWPFTKMYGSFHATMKNKFPKEDSPH